MSSSTQIEKEILTLLQEAYTSRISNLKKSIELGNEALIRSKKLQDKSLVAKSLTQLSLFYMIRGEYEMAMQQAEEAISIYEMLNDEQGVANAKYSIAGIYYKTDNYHMGLVYLIDSLTTFKKFEDYHNQARVQKSLGTIYQYFGDEKNALKSYENAIEAARKVKDLNLESNAYNPLSGIYLKQDKADLAMETIQKSIDIKESTGDVRGLAFAIYGRGKVYAHLGRPKMAERDYLRAIEIHEEMGERLGIGMAYNKLGSLYIEMDQLDDALEVVKKGLAFSKKYNIFMVRFKCSHLLYRIYKKKNDPVNSLEYLETYLIQKEGVINSQTLKVIENYELITRMRALEREAQMQKEKDEIIERKNIAEQAALVKRKFLSNMSHEIRTPLNAISSIASLLSDRPNEAQPELLPSLTESTDKLISLVDDILDFHQLESGDVGIRSLPVKLYSVLEKLEINYKKDADNKGLVYTQSIAPNIWGTYKLDADKLEQVLNHLFSNALKFTDKGHIKLTVKKTGETDEYDRIRFKLSDTGIGIHNSRITEIFESFTQPRSVTKKEHSGSGLGLAIVRKLVDLLGGQVHVSSTLGEGSSFYFELDFEKLNDSGSVNKDLIDKHLLIVEDNPLNALVVKKILSQWGLKTELAQNGEEAVEATSETRFDYILMDIHMPKMNGFEAAQQIKTIPNPNNDTPIIALTADITAQENENYSSYFNRFLLKPIDRDKLLGALKVFI